MGASQGTTKKEQKEEARVWADTKDIEIDTLCGENAKLWNQMRMIQQTIEQQQRDIETLTKKAHQVENEQQQQQQQQQCHAEEQNAMIECDWKLVVSDAELLKTKMRMVALSDRCIERAGFNAVWVRLGNDGQEALLRLRRVSRHGRHQFDTKTEYEQFAKHVCINEFIDTLFIDTRKMSRKEVAELDYSYDAMIERLIENMKKKQ